MFEAVTTSGLLKMDMQGNMLEPRGGGRESRFHIHAEIMKARPEVNCVVHIHTEQGMAVSAQSEGLIPFSQDAMHFYNRLACHDYSGLATGRDRERSPVVSDLGNNHGLLTCAKSVAMAVILTKYLTSRCKSQLMLQSSGARLNIPPPEVCELPRPNGMDTIANRPCRPNGAPS